MERNNDHETVLQLVELDIQRYCFFFCPIPLQKGYIFAEYIQLLVLISLMLILQDFRKIHYSQAQYDLFCFRLVNNIIQKQIDVVLTSGVPVKPVVILFNSFLHLGKILLYVFLIYVQYFILRRVYDRFINLFHHQYNNMIAFCQYPIIKSGRKISRRHMTQYSVITK